MASYTDDQRKAARDLYQARGARYASEQLAIPRRTINEWARTEGWAKRLAATTAEHADRMASVRLGWHVRKQGLADEAAEAAAEVLGMLRERVRARKVYGVWDLARSFGVLTERAAEMSAGIGGADTPTLTPEQSLGRLNTLLDVLEDRQAAGGEPGG
jgi:hypothetical protein